MILILNDNLVMNHLVFQYLLMIKIFDYHMVKNDYYLNNYLMMELNDDKYDDDEDEFEDDLFLMKNKIILY